jgi:sortase B
LKIDNTHIDEPIMQAKDNDFYLRKDYTKNYNYYGSIFMDFRSKINPFGRNTILYGHTIASPYKFYDLKKYKDLNFCNQNPIIELTTIYGKSKWKIFAIYTTSPNFYYIQTDFASDKEYMDLITKMKNKSYFDFDVSLTPNDKILTFSTCAYDYPEARLAVNAKLVQDGESLATQPATVNADRYTSRN